MLDNHAKENRDLRAVHVYSFGCPDTNAGIDHAAGVPHAGVCGSLHSCRCLRAATGITRTRALRRLPTDEKSNHFSPLT